VGATANAEKSEEAMKKPRPILGPGDSIADMYDAYTKFCDTVGQPIKRVAPRAAFWSGASVMLGMIENALTKTVEGETWEQAAERVGRLLLAYRAELEQFHEHMKSRLGDRMHSQNEHGEIE
jgi:hypothetical protein